MSAPTAKSSELPQLFSSFFANLAAAYSSPRASHLFFLHTKRHSPSSYLFNNSVRQERMPFNQMAEVSIPHQPFEFLALPIELRNMVYENLTEVLPILFTCHQTRNEFISAILPKLHLRLHCGTNGHTDNKPWHISTSAIRSSSSHIEEKDLMSWETFKSSRLASATSLRKFICITIRTAWTKPGSGSTIYFMATRARGGRITAKLYKNETVFTLEQGPSPDMGLRAKPRAGDRDEDTEANRRRAEILGSVAKRLCEVISVEDTGGENRLDVWLEKMHEYFQGAVLELD